MNITRKLLFPALCIMLSSSAYAKLTIPMSLTTASNSVEKVGTIIAEDTPYGLLLTPNLHGLTPGVHGFHLHQNSSCADMGKAAGGHFDPQSTGSHLGPYTDQGHLGDMPALFIDISGNATMPMLAPRLKEADFKGHAVMIHADGDNYSDVPKKLGGGGARQACGIVEG